MKIVAEKKVYNAFDGPAVRHIVLQSKNRYYILNVDCKHGSKETMLKKASLEEAAQFAGNTSTTLFCSKRARFMERVRKIAQEKADRVKITEEGIELKGKMTGEELREKEEERCL